MDALGESQVGRVVWTKVLFCFGSLWLRVVFVPNIALSYIPTRLNIKSLKRSDGRTIAILVC